MTQIASNDVNINVKMNNPPSPKSSSLISSMSSTDSENLPLTYKYRAKKKIQQKEVEPTLYSLFSSPVPSPRSSKHSTSIYDKYQTRPTGNKENSLRFYRFAL